MNFPLRTTYLDSPSDLQWLRDVHNVPVRTRVAVLHGNEDAPKRIECYSQNRPLIDDKPFAVLYPNRDHAGSQGGAA